jgi:hypothetical protein
MFSELFINILEEIKINKYKAKDYGKASEMTEIEKKISFLNRYFIYKKIREVNTDKVQLEFSEYSETEMLRNSAETKKAVTIAKQEEIIIKPKVRKLNKKIRLVPATEAIDEVPIIQEKKPNIQEPNIQEPIIQEVTIQEPNIQEPVLKLKKKKEQTEKPKKAVKTRKPANLIIVNEPTNK